MKENFYLNKKICLIFIIAVIFASSFNKAYAKYVYSETFEAGLKFDKTAPVISVTCNGTIEEFPTSQNELISKTDDVIIKASDNVQLDYSKYYYNPEESNFDGITAIEFENTKELTDEGYYKIVAKDTSQNRIEITILIDKSAPEIKVQFYKKGEKLGSLGERKFLREFRGMRSFFATSDELNITEENQVNDEVSDELENVEIMENKIETKDENELSNEIIENLTIEDKKNEDIIEEKIENIIEENESEKTIENEIVDVEVLENIQASLSAVSDVYVGNETEFRNALSSKAATIHVRQSIDFSSSISIDYAVKIVHESADNALRYSGTGIFITVLKGGSLTLSGIVVDTNTAGNNGVIDINIHNEGTATLEGSTIIDGGLGNIGFLIYGGGTLNLKSCEIVRCAHGINLQTNGNLYFGTDNGRCNNFYYNMYAVIIDNFAGSVSFNQNICMHSNNTYGIYIANSSGTINISSGTYYENTYAIYTENITGGSVNVSDGDFYKNGWALRVGGSLNLSGGNIYNNYYGIKTESSYSGKFSMAGGKIYSNTSYDIFHSKANDGGCTITGGTVSGSIYLEGNDNYVNTNSSYPTLTVTPSNYSFKRKLVKTTSNNIANTEISKVTMTPSGSWYKYVNNEYIVVWTGGNVIVKCKDYYGNILKQEILNGSIGSSYSVSLPTFTGYDLQSLPANITGKYTKEDITVELKYDLVNIAQVSYEDLLSNITSAKYWYNANENTFSGAGSDLENGAIFENYGYYKIVVENELGLSKELVFELSKNSFTR